MDLARDGLTGHKKAAGGDYDLIVLDIMLPGMDGIEILKSIRGQGLVTPVLMLTSKSSEIDRILGLELGADDYITKPFPSGNWLPGSKPYSGVWKSLRHERACAGTRHTGRGPGH